MSNGSGTAKAKAAQEQRLPPQAVEAERAVLGAMMLGEEAVARVIETLSTPPRRLGDDEGSA